MDPRNQLFHNIQTALGGHDETDVIAALISSLVVAIGVGSDDLRQANSVINSLPVDMKRVLMAEWPKLRQHRTIAELNHSIDEATH
jgi:hypothetical protein